MTAPAITAADKYREAARELRLRRHVYPTLIAQGHLHQHDANWQIMVMAAIVADYAAQIKDEPGPLFQGFKDH